MEKRVAVKNRGAPLVLELMAVAPARPSRMHHTAIGQEVTRLLSHDQPPGRGAGAPGLGVRKSERQRERVRGTPRKS